MYPDPVGTRGTGTVPWYSTAAQGYVLNLSTFRYLSTAGPRYVQAQLYVPVPSTSRTGIWTASYFLEESQVIEPSKDHGCLTQSFTFFKIKNALRS